MNYQTIIYETADGVATLTLNRPDTYNALSQVMLGELKEVFRQIERDKAVRAVVLTGTGKGFSSGADLTEFSQDLAFDITEALRGGLHTLVTQMRVLEKPVICAVNGVAAGAGASLALAADYRIASENASFVFGAFVNIGLVPDAGSTYLLQRLVGAAKALELALLADAQNRVSAGQALQLGIVNRVVPHADLTAETSSLAARLARMPTRAVGWTKRAIYRAADHSLAEALEYEAQLQGAAFRTNDFKEGVTAFLEKRPPVFTGE